MPRKLKTYVTSIGFFDLAIAAPSMKAALEAWGAGKNAFHYGFAKETHEAKIVAATMAKPGVVLKRGVGTAGAFTENAEPPKSLPARTSKTKPAAPPKQKAKPKTRKKHRETDDKIVSLADARAAKQAAAAYEKEEARREKEEEKRDAAAAKERAEREAAVEKAEAALERAKKSHETAMDKIAAARDRLDEQESEETGRWTKEKKKLESAVRDARS